MSLYPVRVTQDSTHGATQPTRALTAALWRGLQDNGTVTDYEHGSRYRADFVNCANLNLANVGGTGITAMIVGADGNASAQAAAAGGTTPSVQKISGVHGIASVTATTGTDHFGVDALFGAPGDIVPDAGRVYAFETLLNIRKADTGFVGLVETGNVVFSATSTFNDKDFIGFRWVDRGNIKFVIHETGTTETSVDVITFPTASIVTGATAASSGSYNVKLGFRVNGRSSVEIFVNGVYMKTASDTINAGVPASLPTLSMQRLVSLLRGAASDATTVQADVDMLHNYCAA